MQEREKKIAKIKYLSITNKINSYLNNRPIVTRCSRVRFGYVI